jgi:hypothetical protein
MYVSIEYYTQATRYTLYRQYQFYSMLLVYISIIIVDKQGERGEAKVSSGQTSLRTRWRGVKERRSVTTRERGEDPSTSRFTFTINLFITILIGLKLPTFLFYVWTEDIFLSVLLPVFCQYGNVP